MTFIVTSIAAGVAAVAGAIAGVAAAVGSAVAAAVGSTIVAVGSAVLSVVSLISDAVSPILSAVGSIVEGIVTTIGSVLGAVINATGGVLETISAGVKAGIEAVTEALKPIVTFVKKKVFGYIYETIKVVTEPFKPILIPIRDTLKYIHEFITGTQAWIKTQLKPVADLVGLINDISALVLVKRLLSGQMEISEILGDTSKDTTTALAESIFVLYRDIVQTTTDTLEIARNHYTRLRDSIDDTDERLRKDMALAIEFAKATVQGEIDKVRDALSERITPMELEIAGIQRRTEDLPFFQQMLIRALD